MLTTFYAALWVRLTAAGERWHTKRGVASLTSHIGFIAIAVIGLVAVIYAVVTFVLPWATSFIKDITNIQPPTVPSGT